MSLTNHNEHYSRQHAFGGYLQRVIITAEKRGGREAYYSARPDSHGMDTDFATR